MKSSKPVMVDYDGKLVRLYFRVYFFLLFIVIGFAGQKCVKSRVQLHLAQGRQVKLTRMSNWFSGFDSILTLRTIRALPGGWLWCLMVTGFLLNLSSDLVGTLIAQESVHDRCPFGIGLVLNTNPALIEPPHNGKPYFIVAQAQLTSLNNGGLQGVYVKANANLNFSADATDLLGGWSCSRSITQLEYPASTSPSDVASDLIAQNLLYNNPTPIPTCWSHPPEGGESHVIIWDTSAGDITSVSDFSVRIAVDISAYSTSPKLMQGYACTLNDSSGTLSGIQAAIPSRDTLSTWCEVVQGSIYDGWDTPAANNTGTVVEQVLNSMTMVAGGRNFLLDASEVNGTQGCLVARTVVPWAVVVLAAAVALLAGALVLCWSWWAMRMIVLSRGSGDDEERRRRKNEMAYIKEFTPGDIFEWMAQAIGEGHAPQQRQPAKMQELKKWQFGKQGDHFSIVGAGGLANAAETEMAPLMTVRPDMLRSEPSDISALFVPHESVR